ncbi:sensor histidine kinase [Terriglobus tenax]|uniref:sensor histidine kinase n=1 Tax=Terriglobus tenax TaxID=1111115 RepID=UPI0021DF5355|nr:sensor histidine kinase [Terriglobus tenax]
MRYRCSFWPLLATFVCFVSAVLQAQPPVASIRLADYQKQEWQVEDGLPESNVRMVAQRSDGVLLLATFSGVSTFDGQNFQRLTMPNAATMNIDAVNAVLPGMHDDLWIGTDGAGVIHQTASGAVNISSAAGHENERIRTMCFDRDGTLWIATQYGIERYHHEKLETVSGTGIIGGDITTVFAEDLHGGMYFVTSAGLFHWIGGKLTRMATPAEYGEPVAVYRDRASHLWVGTMHAVLEVTERSGHEVSFTGRMRVPTQVTLLTSDRQNNLWIGTKGSGLFRWNAEGASGWSTKDGLPDDTVRTLFVDDEDNLWIGGLTGGLSRWRRAPFAMLQAPGFKPSYSAVAFGDSKGDLWLGTWGQGVFRQHDGVITAVNIPGMPIKTPIRTIAEDKHGRIWVGTWFDGIYSFNGETWNHHKLGIESPVNAVSVLHSDNSGGLWVGTYTGLRYFRNGIPSSSDGETYLPSKLITDLLEDKDGSMLAATSTGLYRISGGQTQMIRDVPHPYVLSLSSDSHGNVWAGSRTGGLSRILGDVAIPLPSDSGLPTMPVYNMLEDEHGHLWLGTSRGIVRLLAAELNDLSVGRISRISSVLFVKQDGMPSSDCSGPSRPSAALLPNGVLYFATSKGFARTTPFAESASITPPNAKIIGWTFGNDTGSESLVTGDRIIIDASESEVNFRFDAHRLSNPAQTEFRYRLTGYDSGWVTTHSRYARYRRIPPGTYTFEVQARVGGDPWMTPVAAISVRQKPHFYSTYTFYLLVAMIVFALGAHLYSRRIRRVKGNMGIVLEERNRIARECHDTLMAGFAAISWQLETASRTLEKESVSLTEARHACDMARSMVSHCQAEARRIIWDLRDTDEVTGVLSQALSKAISSHYKRDDVETRMAVEGREILLPPASVHHLVCIGQEAVSNALRHGQPKSILVHLRYDETALKMVIHDDGVGFPQDRTGTRRGHFGLLVMEERARKIGGRFYLESALNRGTEISVILPYDSPDPARRSSDPDVIRWIGL